MYKCDNCQKISNPGDQLFKVPFETRKKIYEHADREPTFGYETVSEQKLCALCYATYMKVYEEKARTAREQQEKITKEQELKNIRIPVIAPRLVHMPDAIKELRGKFNNRRR